MAYSTQSTLFGLKQAKRLNPYYIRTLGLNSDPPFGLDPASDEFAWRTFVFQLEDEASDKFGIEPLVDDGVFGPSTLQAYRKLNGQDFDCNAHTDIIHFDGKNISINAKVITPNEPGGLDFENFKEKRCYGKRKNLDKVNVIAAHHDAAISPRTAFNIMVRRGVSTAFEIDYDGTIYQLFKDPAKFYQYATGIMNRFSIPFDLSTPADPKYSYLYKRRKIKPPPVIVKRWNGKNKRMLSLFPKQEQAAHELIRVLCNYLEIPFRVPMRGNKFIDGYDPFIIRGPRGKPVSEFSNAGGGIVGHFHCSRRKWDPLMLDFTKIENL